MKIKMINSNMNFSLLKSSKTFYFMTHKLMKKKKVNCQYIFFVFLHQFMSHKIKCCFNSEVHRKNNFPNKKYSNLKTE